MIPTKRHTTFEKPEGGLYQEELFGTAGFSGISSLLYHIYPPTVVSEIKNTGSVAPKIAIEKNMKSLSFKGFSLAPELDFLDSRKTLFVNNDLHIGLAAPKSFSKEYFYQHPIRLADWFLLIYYLLVGPGIEASCYYWNRMMLPELFR